MSFPFSESILHQCDVISETTHRQLEVVRQIVKTFELNQHDLLVDERATLQDEVSNLRNEKAHLEKELWDAKARLRELCDNEDNRSEGNWEFITTPPPKELEVFHRQGNMIRTPCSGANSFGTPYAETDFPEAVDEQLFPQQDTQETLFETQVVIEGENSCQEHRFDAAATHPSGNVLDGSSGNIGLMVAIGTHDGKRMEAAVDTMSLSSATTAASSLLDNLVLLAAPYSY